MFCRRQGRRAFRAGQAAGRGREDPLETWPGDGAGRFDPPPKKRAAPMPPDWFCASGDLLEQGEGSQGEVIEELDH